MEYSYRAYVRPMPGLPWKELCEFRDPDRRTAQDGARTYAEQVLADTAKHGLTFEHASVVVLEGRLKPYGKRVRRKR